MPNRRLNSSTSFRSSQPKKLYYELKRFEIEIFKNLILLLYLMIGLWKFHCKNGKERGVLVLYILHSLKNKQKSGYEILKEIEEKTKGKWVPSKGTLYPLLRQLEHEGLIKISKIDKRSKNIFELTNNGRNTLKQIQKYREESKKKFLLFKDLFIDILDKDESEIEKILFEIRDISHKKSHKNKEKIRKILKKCLSELRAVD